MLLVVLGSWWTRRYPEYSMSAVVTVVTANNKAVESTAHRLYHRHRQGRQRRRLTSNTIPATVSDLNSINPHEHHRQLLQRHASSAASNTNSNTNSNITNTTNDHDHITAARRALTWFHATRHLSRYEYVHRKNEGLDLMWRWNGDYDDDNETDTTTTEQGDASSSSSSSLGFSSWGYNRRRPVNVSNWMTNAGHVDTYQAVPLSQGYGTHLANVWVGSPHPQRKTVIVDTGSHFTAFPCRGCRDCGGAYHTDPYYDPLKSGKFKMQQRIAQNKRNQKQSSTRGPLSRGV